MKGIVIMTAIAKLVSSVALIIVQVVSHHTMTVAIGFQVYIVLLYLIPTYKALSQFFFLDSILETTTSTTTTTKPGSRHFILIY